MLRLRVVHVEKTISRCCKDWSRQRQMQDPQDPNLRPRPVQTSRGYPSWTPRIATSERRVQLPSRPSGASSVHDTSSQLARMNSPRRINRYVDGPLYRRKRIQVAFMMVASVAADLAWDHLRHVGWGLLRNRVFAASSAGAVFEAVADRTHLTRLTKLKQALHLRIVLEARFVQHVADAEALGLVVVIFVHHTQARLETSQRHDCTSSIISNINLVSKSWNFSLLMRLCLLLLCFLRTINATGGRDCGFRLLSRSYSYAIAQTRRCPCWYSSTWGMGRTSRAADDLLHLMETSFAGYIWSLCDVGAGTETSGQSVHSSAITHLQFLEEVLYPRTVLQPGFVNSWLGPLIHASGRHLVPQTRIASRAKTSTRSWTTTHHAPPPELRSVRINSISSEVLVCRTSGHNCLCIRRAWSWRRIQPRTRAQAFTRTRVST